MGLPSVWFLFDSSSSIQHFLEGLSKVQPCEWLACRRDLQLPLFSFPTHWLATRVATKLSWVNSATWWSVKETKRLYISTSYPLRQLKALLSFTPSLVWLVTAWLFMSKYSLFSWVCMICLNYIVLYSLLFIFLTIAQMPQKESTLFFLCVSFFGEPNTIGIIIDCRGAVSWGVGGQWHLSTD